MDWSLKKGATCRLVIFSFVFPNWFPSSSFQAARLKTEGHFWVALHTAVAVVTVIMDAHPPPKAELRHHWTLLTCRCSGAKTEWRASMPFLRRDRQNIKENRRSGHSENIGLEQLALQYLTSKQICNSESIVLATLVQQDGWPVRHWRPPHHVFGVSISRSSPIPPHGISSADFLWCRNHQREPSVIKPASFTWQPQCQKWPGIFSAVLLLYFASWTCVTVGVVFLPDFCKKKYFDRIWGNTLWFNNMMGKPQKLCAFFIAENFCSSPGVPAKLGLCAL